jgi:integrase
MRANEGLDQGVRTPVAEVKVAFVCDQYLEHSKLHHKPGTYELSRLRLQDFCDRVGGLTISALKPFHVNRWLESHKWGQSTTSGAIAVLKAAINRAVAEGFISENPLRSLKKPAIKQREAIVTAEQFKMMLDVTPDQEFRDVLVALYESGARPGEVMGITAQDVNFDGGIWVIKEHKTLAKSGRPRVIPLSSTLITLSRRLVALHPTGLLFRNTDGGAWNRNAIRCRFRHFREKHGLDPAVVAYSLRHTFATDALAKDVPIATVAELLGHKGTKMVEAHYSHLHEKREYLKASVRTIRPEES